VLFQESNQSIPYPMHLSLRVGRDDARSRQDIVLSGHFIQDEHCTFSSTAGSGGEGETELTDCGRTMVVSISSSSTRRIISRFRLRAPEVIGSVEAGTIETGLWTKETWTSEAIVIVNYKLGGSSPEC
jgi:hypothetical protein